MSKPRVIIVGGGFGGYFTARHLQKTCRNQTDLELISNINYFVFQPLLPEVAAGTLNAQDAVTPLRTLLRDTRVRLAEVQAVDPERKELQILQGQKRLLQTLQYDQLVLATGQVTNLSLFPGFENYSLTMKDLDDAYRLRNHVIECMEIADITRFADMKRRALTFVVAGGGFSGVETIGEIAEMLERVLPQYPNVRADELRLVLVQRGHRILPEMPEQLSEYALKALRRRNIEIMVDTSICSASHYGVRVQHREASNAEHIDTRTIVTTIGNGPSTFIQGLPVQLERGRIVVNDDFSVPGMDSTWALGDCARVPVPCAEGGKAFAPPTAQFAARQARQLARNIAASLEQRPTQAFCYQSRGMLASLGGYRGVAEMFGIKLTGLPAWLAWRAIYIGMLPGFGTRLRVALNWLFDYFMPRTIVHMGQSEQTATRYLNFSAGECVQKADEVPQAFYIVIDGALQLRSCDGDETLERLLGPGDSWGSLAIKENRLTRFEVNAQSDCTILALSTTDFSRLRNAFTPLDEHLQQQGR